MNRLLTLILAGGVAGLLSSCGSSVKSTTQPAVHDEYSVVVTPDQFTLNAGDWSTISAAVDLSNQNSTPRPVSPQPTIKFYSSDPRVTVSAAGEVCAGQWDVRYLTCTPTVFPQSSPNAGQVDLPTGQVTITAVDAAHSVSGTTLVSIHPRAVSISLSAPVGTSAQESAADHKYSPTGCVSQGNFVQYVATPDFNGITGGTVLTNDYTWASSDPNVAQVSDYGFVTARAPGVANIYAKLNGTISAPLAFATCPPSAITVGTSPFTANTLPKPPYNTNDLVLNKGDQQYLTATVTDTNGSPVTNLSLNYIASNPVTASFATINPLTAKVGASTSGHFSMMASCEPSTCNNAVEDFLSPAGLIVGNNAGFGYPIYSNAIGATVEGITPSFVLVTNSADVANPLHRLLVFDSESLTVTQRIEVANLPNSLVVAPNGTKAYLGSDAGLVVVDLTSYQSSIQTFPIIGGISTDIVTGAVLGVSPDSRYVVISDVANGLVFFIDTTGTKAAARFVIPGITSVTFAPDNSNIWIAGSQGVYVFNADTFVKTATSNGVSTGVKALAWVPDGQSYVASGDQVIDYSTCNDKFVQNVPAPNGTPQELSTIVLAGMPHLIGLSPSDQWLNYTVTSSSQVGSTPLAGNVCLSSVAVSAPTATAAGVTCASPQVSFSPRLQQAFITGYPSTNGVSSCATAEPVIHGFDENGNSVFTLTTAGNSAITPLSGGVLSDGRFAYVGTFDTTTGTSTLHRFAIGIDSTTGIGTKTGAEDLSSSVELVPSLVAVVPK